MSQLTYTSGAKIPTKKRGYFKLNQDKDTEFFHSQVNLFEIASAQILFIFTKKKQEEVDAFILCYNLKEYMASNKYHLHLKILKENSIFDNIGAVNKFNEARYDYAGFSPLYDHPLRLLLALCDFNREEHEAHLILKYIFSERKKTDLKKIEDKFINEIIPKSKAKYNKVGIDIEMPVKSLLTSNIDYLRNVIRWALLSVNNHNIYFSKDVENV